MVLHGLIHGDGATELGARLGVFGSHAGALAGDAGCLGGQQGAGDVDQRLGGAGQYLGRGTIECHSGGAAAGVEVGRGGDGNARSRAIDEHHVVAHAGHDELGEFATEHGNGAAHGAARHRQRGVERHAGHERTIGQAGQQAGLGGIGRCGGNERAGNDGGCERPGCDGDAQFFDHHHEFG